MFKFILLFCTLLLSSSSWADSTSLCLSSDKNCTFVLARDTQNLVTVNPSRAQHRFSPFSTFKIANALIALERGIIKDTEQILTFDKTKYVPQTWWPAVWKLPQYNLKIAFKYSMVAVFRQLAFDIGQQGMAEQVKRLNYGNGDISSGLDDFWLGGSLQISAVEQVALLQDIYHNRLGLKTSTLTALKDIMLVEETSDYKLYAKTGAGRLGNSSMLGWYVGFVENKQGVFYFALNITEPSYAEVKAKRVKMALAHLTKENVL